MKIAVIGASGYIGRNLIDRLIKNTNHEIVALSRNAESINLSSPKLQKHNVSVFDDNLSTYIKDCEAVYYLIHMMSQTKIDYAKAEIEAAEKLASAVEGSNIKKIIYLGGLGNDKDNLSKHLASRHRTGEILREIKCQAIEFRASMIIGEGSISYDIIVSLVSKLPLLTVPKWSETLTQPIGLNDALSYLVASLDIKSNQNEIIEIGGPDVISYEQLMRDYAKWKGLKRLFIRIPIIPIVVSAWWLNLFTPKNEAKVGQAMIESLQNKMIVTNKRASELFPDIHPEPLLRVFV
ncbi:MAG: NAD(P)H-binding protein [bacterium]|jgi:uncharacterized protein YbjT (DUF2867 family)